MADQGRIPKWFVAACLLPWVVLIDPYVEALVVRVVLSRWPRPILDDPKGLPTWPLHCLFQLLFVSLGVAFVTLILSVARYWPRLRTDWRYGAWTLGFCLGVATLWFASHSGPRWIWDWYLD